MSRSMFGGSEDDYAVDAAGNPAQLRRVHFYTSAARTTEITDLASDATGTGSPLTVRTDSQGFWGPVYGPSGTTVMYAAAEDAKGGLPTRVVAIYPHTAVDPAATYGPVLLPSGDTTGATDIAAINAALLAGVQVTLRGGTFYINAPIRQPSNTTLVLHEATVYLVSGSNCNLWQNFSLGSALDSQISIKGIGRALFHGNATGQVRQNVAKTDGTSGTSFAANVGVYPVRIDGFRLEDVQIGPTNAYAFYGAGLTNFRISRVRLEQDASTSNQDGIDLGPGCQSGVIENITGRSGDDAITLMAIQWWKNTQPDAVPAAYQVGSALTLDQQDIHIRNVQVQAGINLVRILNDGVCKVSRVFGSGLKNTGRSGIISFGPNQYVNASHLPGAGSISQIQFDGIAGGSPISANSGYAIDISTPVKHVQVRNLDVGAFNTGTAYGWKAILGSGNAIIGTPFAVSDVLVDGVTSGSTVTANVGDIVKFQAGVTVSDVHVKRVKVAEANSISNSAAAITNLKLRDIEVGTIYDKAFKIADTGDFDDIRIGTYSGVSGTYNVALAAKLGAAMPVFTSNDTAPLATVTGSRLRTDGTLDPNGGVDTAGGEWVANGTTWVKVTTPVDGFAQDGLGSPMVATYYYPVWGSTVTTLTPSDGLMRGGFLLVDRSCTLDQIGLEVTGAGSAGSVVRLGIYKIASGQSMTANLVLDAGTIDSTTTGTKTLTISQKVNAGDKLFVVAASQGAAGTQPVLRAVSGFVPYITATNSATASGNALVGHTQSGVTGALPASFTVNGTTTAPRAMLRAS